MTQKKITKNSIYHVGGLERGLSILEVMAKEHRPLRLTEISKILNINNTSVTRMCHTLCELGFIRRDAQKRYRMALKVLTLGYSVLQGLKWLEAVELRLKQLFDQVQQTVNLGILNGQEVLYLIRLRKNKYMPFDIQVGSTVPLYCTALGRAHLAFCRPETFAKIWAKIELKPMGPRTITQKGELQRQIAIGKENGYTFVDEEMIPGIIAVACPILDCEGFALMAINISVSKKEHTLEAIMENMLPMLLDAAKDVSRILMDMKITQKDIVGYSLQQN